MRNRQEQGEVGRSSRRTFLKTLGAAALVVKGGLPVWAADAPAQAVPFRFAFLTDIHINPEKRGDEGFRACLRAVQAMNPRPDFIVTGGDLVSDALRADVKKAGALYDLYVKVCSESKIPIYNCIGNHEPCGWDALSGVAKDDPLYGKKMPMAKLGMEKTTYSFDHKGWHFVVLDDVEPGPDRPWEGAVTAENLEWLDRDLASAGDRPKVVIAHIPFMSASVYGYAKCDEKTGRLNMTSASVCKNPRPVLDLLRRHKVGLTLTGHTHENERIEYRGTSHVVQAAVCGNWWRTPHIDRPQGFGLIDVQPDGRFEHSFHGYTWEA